MNVNDGENYVGKFLKPIFSALAKWYIIFEISFDFSSYKLKNGFIGGTFKSTKKVGTKLLKQNIPNLGHDLKKKKKTAYKFTFIVVFCKYDFFLNLSILFEIIFEAPHSRTH